MLKLKICGLRRKEDIDIVNKYNIDYIGFVFAGSPRKVSYEQAKELSALLREDIIPVGVFVNEHMKLIVDLYKEGIIKIAQLHGDEDEDYIKNLKAKSLEQTGHEIPVINAIEINNANNYDNFNDKLLEWRDSVSDYFILDSGKGSGKTFDWSLLDKNSEFFKNSIFLAGGLNSENLDSAIKEFNPYAVDLSSSVETDGFKDEEKIKEIVEIVERYRN
ncbi:phosphoribosylanthranilate isomerase TrpF [Methanobrevibacter ruminantium M1]|uniref:N-(5'-phosphoribosyl)anthranilate isomerase n=1 Tax=Methanobrevibacter ruminantium (strain ATCC 35063 / DSM 1093 / JCM 13430 / OCM 146 / M1) TaxID=634498 RepID=D3DZA9_METRM|nr:phosphoribosylanthranilate isomerase [Methanobrevibacter ruminantium]ADC46064.1 phosphoribosylanthranilate isomerase TrpF [Methanobrevibacter ruminantium M1]